MDNLAKNLHSLTDKFSRFQPEILDQLMDPLPYAIFEKDANGRWQYANALAKTIFHLENIDWKYKTDLQLAQENAPFRDAHLACLESDKKAWQNASLTKSIEGGFVINGVVNQFEVHKLPLFDNFQKPVALFVIAQNITALKKIEAEQQLALQIKDQINKILIASLDEASLQDCLYNVLNIILDSPFLCTNKKGAILLTSAKGEKFQVVVGNERINSNCAHCEKILFTKGLYFNDPGRQDELTSLLSAHDNVLTHHCLIQKGHYCVPIVSLSNLTGILVIFVEKEQNTDTSILDFLASISKIIAGIIDRKKAEEQVYESLKFFSDSDRINTQLIKSGDNIELKSVYKDLLDEIRQIFDVNRAWLVYPCDPDVDTWKMVMKSYSPGYSGLFEVGNEYTKMDMDKAIDRVLLATNEPSVFDFNNFVDFPKPETPRNTFLGTLITVVRPRIGKAWILGIDQCDRNRVWNEMEKKLMKQISIRFSETINSFLLLETLKHNEAKYKSLSETAQDIIMAYDYDGNIHYINSVGLSFLGLDFNYYKNANIFDIIAPYHRDLVEKRKEKFNSGNSDGGVVQLDLINENNEYVPFEFNSSPILLEDSVPGVISVMRNIQQRKQVEAQILKQNAELQLINNELDKFVYRTSHDLRSPLTSVMGLIELLRTAETKDDTNIYLDMMEQSVKRVDAVIMNILDYSRNRKFELQFEHVDVLDIYMDIVDSIAFVKGAENIIHENHIDQSIPFATDKYSLRTIMSNLITNAVKYRRAGIKSYIRFDYKANNEAAIFTVADNGEGIAENKYDTIFEMFYRNSNAAEGSGLGLYIVRQTINRLGGSISVESKLGQGTIFTVILPNQFNAIQATL